MECGIVTVDLHGRNTYQAKVTVDALLRRAGAEETTLYADLDVERLEAVRAQLPILSARRTDLYEVREK